MLVAIAIFGNFVHTTLNWKAIGIRPGDEAMQMHQFNSYNAQTLLHPFAGPIVFNFITTPRNHTTSQSRRVEFQCSVRSTLIPTFVWNFTRKGTSEAETIVNKRGALSVDYSIIAGQRSQVLVITNVQWRYEGEYKCIVSSENSQIQAEANLNVHSKSCNMNDTHSFKCFVYISGQFL